MSELLRRAAALKAEAAEFAAAERQRKAREEAEQTARYQAALRDSRKNAAEFVGVMLRKQVPTIPLYQEVRHRGNFTPSHISTHTVTSHDHTLRWVHRADGWLVREPARPYDEEPISGLFVANNRDFYLCNGPFETKGTREVPEYVRAGIQTEKFVVADPYFENDEYSQWGPDSDRRTDFAGAAGAAILASALVRYDAV